MKRRKAIKETVKFTGGIVGASLLPWTTGCSTEKNTDESATDESTDDKAEVGSALFSISLAQWSLHRAFYGKSTELSWEERGKMFQEDPNSVLQGDIDPIDFPSIAKNTYGIDAVEYVNSFYFDKAKNASYLSELKNRCESEGVQSVLIMCDALGNLGDPDDTERTQVVENHYPWVEAAKYLGCHSIRVNARSTGEFEEQQKLAADGLIRLCEFSKDLEINIIVENHGGLSSNGQWLAGVMDLVDHPMAGTLPDFGNFRLGEDEWYDRYQGVKELMPYAKGVSAKSNDFDEEGNETNTDYTRMVNIVMEAGYHGYIGIEYEGNDLSEPEGINATKALLEKVRNSLA